MRKLAALFLLLALPTLVILQEPMRAQEAEAKARGIHDSRAGLSTQALMQMDLGPDIEVKSEVSYIEGESDANRSLDIYTPRLLDGKPLKPGTKLPVVVFFHGGNWTAGGGDKRHGKAIASGLCEAGFVVVSITYRGADRTRASQFPRFMNDAAQGVDWVAKHIGDYAGDVGKLFLVGHSAGGHIATLLAYQDTWLKEYGHDAAKLIRGVVGISGIYYIPTQEDASDYRAVARHLDIPFPKSAEIRRKASPIGHASAAAPPSNFFFGDDDLEHLDTVALGAWVTLRAFGVETAYYEIAERSHESILRDFGVTGDETTEKTIAFLKAQLKVLR